MENKVKMLKRILTIGAVILLIAGISFQFASSIEDYVRVLTMGLISGVFVFLSVYEEKSLDYKFGSVVSHIFACVGVFITYIALGANELLGSWFSTDGDGALIFFGCLFFLIALLILISAVRYKIYKLIELSVWISVIGLVVIAKHFNADGYLSLVIVLTVLLVNNIFRMNAFSKWFTIGMTIIVTFLICGNELVITSLLLLTTVANLLFIILKEKKTVLVPLTISIVAVCLYALDIINSTIVAVGFIAVMDFICLFFNVYSNKIKSIFHKVIINLFLLLMVFIPTDPMFTYIIPCIVLISSLVNIYLVKDEKEEYLLPVKAFYFVIVEMNNIDIFEFESYMIVFAANFVNLLLYFFSKKKSVSYVNLVLLLITNVVALLSSDQDLVGNIIYLILFYLDFYIVYLKEEKLNLTLSIIFPIYTALCLMKMVDSSDVPYLVSGIAVFGIYLWMTRKNKAIYCTSLVGFIACLSKYLSTIISNEIVLGLLIEIIVTIGIALFQVIFDKRGDKSNVIGIIAGLQIGLTLLAPVNILLKVFVLVESIALILISLIGDEFKNLSDEGLIGVIASLLVIIGSIDNLPKSLYLIIVGLVIIVTVPFFIKKYLKKLEEERKLEALKPKEEPKVETKPQTEYKLNYCGSCGTKVEGDYVFCPNCGNKIR